MSVRVNCSSSYNSFRDRGGCDRNQRVTEVVTMTYRVTVAERMTMTVRAFLWKVLLDELRDADCPTTPNLSICSSRQQVRPEDPTELDFSLEENAIPPLFSDPK